MPAGSTCHRCNAQDVKKDAYKNSRWFTSWQAGELSDLLSHNDEIGADARRSVKVSLKQANEELLSLKSKERYLEEQLDKLRVRKSEVEKVIADYRSLTTPVRALPREMLEEILQLSSTASPTVLKHSPGVTLSNGPWHLGQVCRKWREVVVTTPQLWSDIRTDIDPYKDEPDSHDSHDGELTAEEIIGNVDRFVEELSFYINEGFKRSGTRSLNLTFLCWDVNVGKTAISIFLPQSFRWKSVCMSVDPQLASALTSLEDHLGELRSLTFSRGSITDSLIKCFGSSSDLQSLCLQYDHNGTGTFPWRYLKRLHAYDMDSETVASLMRLNPELVHLHCSLYQDQDLNGDVVIHHNLRKLDINLPNFLRAVTLPALDELEIGSYHFTNRFTCDNFIHFLNRSNCQLTHLTLRNIHFAKLPYELRNLRSLHLELRLVVYNHEPSIQDFTAWFKNEFAVRHMEVNESDTSYPFLPALQHLTFSFLNPNNISTLLPMILTPTFIATLEGRRRFSSLLSLCLQLSASQVQMIRSGRNENLTRAFTQLENLRDSGLEVVINSESCVPRN